MNSDEQIQCKKCGDGTNDCPDDFPPECKGYCPHCAIVGWEEGWLPKPTNQAMKNYLLAALLNKLNGLVSDLPPLDTSASGAWTMVGATEESNAYIVTQCLN